MSWLLVSLLYRKEEEFPLTKIMSCISNKTRHPKNLTYFQRHAVSTFCTPVSYVANQVASEILFLRCRCSTPAERFSAEVHIPNTTSASQERTTNHDQLDDAIPVSHKQPAVDQYEWDDGLHPAIPYVAATDIPLMISPSGYFETHLGKTSQGQGSQFTVAPRGSRCSAWKSQSYGGQGSSDKAEEEQGNTSPCQETSSQQSEKDQRMWSALKTSLLSGSEADTDSTFLGLDRTDEGVSPDGGSVDNPDPDFAIRGEERHYAFLKGTRDMEQLDLERSAMDRTMRPHRVASARLLETNQASPVQTKVDISLLLVDSWLSTSVIRYLLAESPISRASVRLKFFK